MTIKSLIRRNYKKQPSLDYPDYKSSIFRAPKNDKFSIPDSISEVSGPIFNKKIIGKLDNDLTQIFQKIKKRP